MTITLDREPMTMTVPQRRRGRGLGVLAVWLASLAAVRLWGLWIVDRSRGDLFLGAVPLFGAWQWLITPRLVLPLVVAVLACIALPVVSTGCSWRRVLVVVALFTVLWSAALAFADAPASRWSSIHSDYGQHIERIEQRGLGDFLRDYVDDQATFPTHLQAHPPGLVVLLWTADHIGLRGNGFESSLALLGSAAATVAALVALREVAGERMARRAAPFVVLAPAAVWHTNADVVFAGFAVTAVALVVVASNRAGWRRDALALGGGVVFGCSLLLTYGVALLAIPMVAVAVARRRLQAVAVAGTAAIATLALPALWGFSWVAGLRATSHQYDLNLATVRPYSYFLFANLAVFSLALGPAVVVGLTRVRDRRVWLLVGAALAAVAVADVTGLSSAEVERIWQPFMPLALLGASGLVARERGSSIHSIRAWLVAQAVTAITLQAALRSPW